MNYTAVHAATLVGLLYYCGTSDIIINGLCSNSCLYQLSTVSCIFSQYTSKKFYHCEFVVCDLPDQLSPMAVSVIILVGTQLVHAVYVHSRLQQTSEIQGGGGTKLNDDTLQFCLQQMNAFTEFYDSWHI